MGRTSNSAFTLAELLIALAILGVIATFTIPKILAGQQSSQYNAIAKEDISAISAAFQQAKMAGSVSSSTTIGDLTQYLNYTSYVTSATVDGINGSTSEACSGAAPCIFMHNGSSIRYNTYNFGGTDTTNALYVQMDPDGFYSRTTNGNGKAVGLWLYYDGRVADEGTITAGTTNSHGSYTADATKNPAWFSW